MHRSHVTFAIAGLGALAGAAQAQTNLSPAHKMSWGENIGWMNWRDAGSPIGAQGVRVLPDYLGGFAWSETVGWVSLGDGTPANGFAYSNTSGADFGVNVLPSGNLDGLAWGENIGWIDFGTASTLGAHGQQARWDDNAQRFYGYAWGENVGWISLDDAEHFVGQGCGMADVNADGVLNLDDIALFADAFVAGDLLADMDANGLLNLDDVAFFAQAFLLGCP